MTPPHETWPLPFRKLTSEVVRSLSDEEFNFLCRSVYRRARRHQKSARQAHELVRRLIHRRREGSGSIPTLSNLHHEMFWARRRDDQILDSLCSDRVKRWVPPFRRKDVVHFSLNNFSFVDAPNDTMTQLHDIAVAECTARSGALDFGDSQILDIGPYVVWGLMSRKMAPFLSGGKMGVSVQKVIEAVRLRQFMRMKEFTGLKDHKDVWAFTLKERNAGTPTATPDKAISFSKVADELVETVDEWLGALPDPMRLTKQAQGHINKIATEILDNAERHSQPGSLRGDWYVAGFMARRELNGQGDTSTIWYDCHVAIVNLGTTIAQRILQSPKEMREDLDRYTVRHRARTRQSRNALATLYAMQDGVSSLPESHGGKGMMDVVGFVNALGNTEDPTHQPRVTIISGRSCIRFVGPYKGYQLSTKGRRVQAFNVGGSFEIPPDDDYVFDLDFGFPGTIVALRFSLDYAARVERAAQK